MTDMLRRGVRKGVETTWVLSKVIVPITIAVTLLKHTPVIEWVVGLFAPVMGVIGLPGEAAVVLTLGFLLNLYAAIAAMAALGLAPAELLILTVMLSFAHNLLVEGAVAKRIGLSMSLVTLTRLAVAFLSGWFLHLGLGNEVQVWSEAVDRGAVYLWEQSLLTTGMEIVETVVPSVGKLALIVMPLMIVIQVLKEKQVLNRLAHTLNPALRWLGLSEKGAIPVLAGLVFGLAYGAGVIIEATREQPLPKRELYLLMLFLILCHAVVEDTLIFLPLDVNVWMLLAIRTLAAVVLTAVAARIWRTRRGAKQQAGHLTR